jgi:NADH:ubiquinone oxidoreductase subunit 6 (chain J)
MSLFNLIFYALILMTAGAALFMIITNNVLHAALGLIVCLLGMAGIFAVMGAEFLAVTQIMVYAGGVIVLIIFGIMLTNRTRLRRNRSIDICFRD